MKRLVTAGACALAALAVPAAAQAKASTGTVLQANRAHHSVELVDGRHVVHSYVLTGRGKAVRAGSRVSFQAHGRHIGSLHVVGRSRKVSYYGKVVTSGSKGLVLKLGDGRRVRLGRKSAKKTRRARAAGSVTVNIQGLQSGQTVLVTQTDDGAGNLTITVKIVPNGDQNAGEDQDATGTVTAVGTDSVTVNVDGRGPTTFQADPDLLSGLSVGDQVDVTYYQDTDGTFVADDIQSAGDNSGGDSGGDQDAVGTVTAIGNGSLTVNVDGSRPMTFQADSDLLSGVSVGDRVDVTYYQDTDGTLLADDVEPADTSGTQQQPQPPAGSQDSPGGANPPTLPPLGGHGRG